MSTSIITNLGQRLRRGRELAREKHKEGDTKKLGNLRAGNSGIMSHDGDIAGSCHRLAHLRQLGVEVEEPSDSKLIMFQMGIANEDVVYADLLHTAAPDEVILREEEIPIEWFTGNKTKVTGRPDMVVCRKIPVAETEPNARLVPTEREGLVTPVFGVEIKSVASIWTTREVLFNGEPKLENLVQAAHYSWQVGVPFRLMYKQYSNQVAPSWAQKFFPKQGMPLSEHIEYNDKGDVKNINPYEIVYELQFSDKGILEYRVEASNSKWIKTIVSKSDIENYYEFISKMPVTKDLGGRPLTLSPTGKEKSFDKCGYCALQTVCDKTEKKGYDKWLHAVRKELNK